MESNHISYLVRQSGLTYFQALMASELPNTLLGVGASGGIRTLNHLSVAF